MLIVYNAFNGRYADSPRVVHQTLLATGRDDEHVWLHDARFADRFPAGVSTVPIGSPAAVEALEASDVLVNNTHVQLDRWRKPARTCYLQTWHGTPLKRIHRAAVSVPGEELMVELDRDIAEWDLLVTQSPAATILLRSAFSYGGAVLETGYPRNDVLFAPDAEQRRAQLREQLGIPDGVTAVLYAPTYRDDEVDGAEPPDRLIAAALLERLGEGHMLLLRHHYFLFHRPEKIGVPGLLDVSTYPEIADLYLAADVLVTDYSSAMFDFAVTSKPILLYVYDLDRYVGEVRGFTFDLNVESPGPILRDQDQLAHALLDLESVRTEYAERYAAFRQRYCGLEDGHAGERVVQGLLAAVSART